MPQAKQTIIFTNPPLYKYGQAPAVCQLHGCDNDRHGRGLCCSHLRRWTKDGSPDKWKVEVPIKAGKRPKDEKKKPKEKRSPKKAEKRHPCFVRGCQKPRTTRILCFLHNEEWVTIGDLKDVWKTSDGVIVHMRIEDPKSISSKLVPVQSPTDPEFEANEEPEENETMTDDNPPNPDIGPGYHNVDQLEFYMRRRRAER